MNQKSQDVFDEYSCAEDKQIRNSTDKKHSQGKSNRNCSANSLKSRIKERNSSFVDRRKSFNKVKNETSIRYIFYLFFISRV